MLVMIKNLLDLRTYHSGPYFGGVNQIKKVIHSIDSHASMCGYALHPKTIKDSIARWLRKSRLE